jgi:hypothetical protein
MTERHFSPPFGLSPGVCGTGAFLLRRDAAWRLRQLLVLRLGHMPSENQERWRVTTGSRLAWSTMFGERHYGAAMFSELMLALMILAPCIGGLLMVLLLSVLASDEHIDSVAPSAEHLD